MPTVKERFWAKVQKTEGCWQWSGSRRNGYGLFWLEGKNRSAHRIAYEWLVGPIRDGLVIDHLCRNPPCVNPSHLEPVTQRVNIVRGVAPTALNAAATHCKNGHEFTPENTYLRPNGVARRQCLTCLRLTDAARATTDRGPASERTHCPQGHAYSEENTYRAPSGRGGRQCRKCNADRSRRRGD